MKNSLKFLSIGIAALTLSGCVVTQYKNKKGEDCTRKYFTVLGIPWHSCQEAPAGGTAAAAPAAEAGTAIPVAAAEKNQATANYVKQQVAQNIKAATQRVR
jgi:hypothetical protein